jgi:hypothetical protein
MQADSSVGQETLGRWLTIAKLLAARSLSY